MSEGLADACRFVGSRGYYSGMVHRLPFGRVAEWQTRWLQVPVSFGTWGFKSPFAHAVMSRIMGYRFLRLLAGEICLVGADKMPPGRQLI